MWDRDGAEITVDNFGSVVRQFRHSNSFLIRLSISSKSNTSLLAQVYFLAVLSICKSWIFATNTFSFQELKLYLMENGFRTLFIEDERNQETKNRMNSKSINQLAKKLCEFIEVKFETLANSDHISNVCNNAVQLFPSIGEVVSFSVRKLSIYSSCFLIYLYFKHTWITGGSLWFKKQERARLP